MGFLKYLGIAGLVALLVLVALWMTNVQPPAATNDYPTQVLKILEFKNIGQDPGFKLTMNELMSDMECGPASDGTDTCKLKIRFQHVQLLALQDVPRIKLYQGEVCALKAPENYRSDRAQLCDSLEKIYRELDTMQLSMSQVLKLMRGSTPQVLGTILDGFVQRLEKSRQKFIGITKDLYKIHWLEPALPPVPTQ
ncbi:hypothetical protein HY230_06960 [Candidatus Acetothermia bacterium]|nr:hypothetical protein [Candidatus Acetothermia bacterium]